MSLTPMQTLAIILAVAAGTQLTRWLPFWLFPENRKPPAAVTYLGRVLPPAMMGLLVVYCLKGVTWLGAGSWDPCNFATTTPVRSLADLKGKRVFSFPTGGRFMSRFGVIPVSLPWEDIQVALQTGELDGVCWSGITEDYTAGWADVCMYYLTNNIIGGWIGSYFANSEKWNALPEHLKVLFRLTCDSSHYYRQHWYWWGEAHYRVTGGKMQLTSIPDAEWKQVEPEAHKFWDEVAARSPRCARVVEILKQYNAEMEKAGRPYRY